MPIQKIVPFLWYTKEAEEAAAFYAGIFPESRVKRVVAMPSESPSGQAELDRYWNALLEGGGAPEACGWLKDRFGVSWQITPTVIFEMMADPDRARQARHRRDAQDGQARHRRAAGGLRGERVIRRAERRAAPKPACVPSGDRPMYPWDEGLTVSL